VHAAACGSACSRRTEKSHGWCEPGAHGAHAPSAAPPAPATHWHMAGPRIPTAASAKLWGAHATHGPALTPARAHALSAHATDWPPPGQKRPASHSAQP